MTASSSLSNEMTRGMDFAGGTVIHISWYSVLLVAVLITAVLWLSRRKR